MELTEIIRKRRMVRNYRSDPVDPQVVDRIVAVARRAPSAGFSQGQSFIVVTDPTTRRAIADLADEPEYVAQGFDPWMSRAPVHVVVCVSETDYHQRYQEPDKVTAEGDEIDWPVPYWFVDAGASLMLLLLAAVDQGLGAGFFGVHRLPGLKDLLGIPADVTPIGVVTLGHPAPDRASGSLRRGWRKIAQVVHHERWTTPPSPSG
ncbi:MAG: nitroreductase family protein [Actinomycetota bacterium]|nr:nitroreductase family protein [Actinomycetota bacterium]